MRELLIIIVCMVIAFASAVTHERDMYNNLLETGDAKAWTVTITSKEMMKNKKEK